MLLLLHPSPARAYGRFFIWGRGTLNQVSAFEVAGMESSNNNEVSGNMKGFGQTMICGVFDPGRTLLQAVTCSARFILDVPGLLGLVA